MSVTARAQGRVGVASLVGFAAASYAVYVAVAWLRYGHRCACGARRRRCVSRSVHARYEVVERHHIDVAAPADVTFAALMDMDLEDSHVIRAIFKGRELLLGADADKKPQARGLVAVTKALGWGVLADVAGSRDCDGRRHAALEARTSSSAACRPTSSPRSTSPAT